MSDLVSGQLLTDMINNPPINLVQAENFVVVNKALNLVMRDLDCGPQEAFAAICRDWLELRGVEILSPNPLADSTPVAYKPSLADRIKKFL